MIKSYAVINNNDNERMNSSSGGIISLFAKKTIDRSGIVYGVENLITKMKFVAVEDKEDIAKIRGSKYVKANNFSWVFENIKKNIKDNIPFLFVGTPCQVKAVRNLVEKEDYNNCLLVDLICHGVMNENFYNKYINWIEGKYKESIKSITFRDKEKGWKNQEWGITLASSHKVTREDVEILKNIYYAHYAHEEVCLACKFTNLDRPGDITIGDLWGVENDESIKDDNKGINLVIVNNSKGQTELSLILDDIWCKEVNLIDYTQPQLKENIKTNMKERELFIKGIDNFGKITKVMFNRSLYYRIIRNIKLKVIKR